MSSKVEIVTGSLKGTIIENAASEATLQEILHAIRQLDNTMSRNAGGSGGNNQANRNQQSSSPFSSILGAASNMIGSTLGAFGATLGTTTKLLMSGNTSLSTWTKGLSGAASGLPLFGSLIGTAGDALGTLIGHLENWNSTLKSLSSVGAGFNNSIIDLRKAAADAYLSLDDYARIVTSNASGFAALGGTVTKGALAFSKISNTLMAPGGFGEQLVNMGMSVNEVNSGLAKYLSTTMKGTQISSEDTQKVSALYADYATTLDRISKLSGEEKNALEAKAQAVKNDAMWQVKMAGMAPEMRAKMEKELLQAGEVYGVKGQQALKEIFLTGQVVTKDSRMLASAFPAMADGMRKGISMAKDKNVSDAQFEVELKKRRQDERVAAANRIKDMEGSLSAGAAGIGGTAGEMANVVADTAKGLAGYNTDFRNLTKEQIAEREEAAKKEQSATSQVTQLLDQFGLAMTQFYNGFMSSLLPVIEDVAGSIKAGDLAKNFREFGARLGEFVKDMIPYIRKIIPVIEEFFNNLTSEKGRQIIVDRLELLFDMVMLSIRKWLGQSWLGRQIGGFNEKEAAAEQKRIDLKKQEIQTRQDQLTEERTQNKAKQDQERAAQQEAKTKKDISEGKYTPQTEAKKASEAQLAEDAKTPFKGSQKEFYDKMYSTLLEQAKKQGVANPEAIARLGAAQSSLETGYGKSTAGGNNYFGIKAKPGDGTASNVSTQEYDPKTGKMVTIKAGFRKYNNMEESAADYIKFLQENKRYKGVLGAKTAEQALIEQGKTGYATDPDYVAKLQGINARGQAGTLSNAAPKSAETKVADAKPATKSEAKPETPSTTQATPVANQTLTPEQARAKYIAAAEAARAKATPVSSKLAEATEKKPESKVEATEKKAEAKPETKVETAQATITTPPTAQMPSPELAAKAAKEQEEAAQKKAEEQKIAQRKLKEEAERARASATPPGTPKETATLSDVVAALKTVNTTLSELLAQHEDIGRSQLRVAKASSGNLVA